MSNMKPYLFFNGAEYEGVKATNGHYTRVVPDMPGFEVSNIYRRDIYELMPIPYHLYVRREIAFPGTVERIYVYLRSGTELNLDHIFRAMHDALIKAAGAPT